MRRALACVVLVLVAAGCGSSATHDPNEQAIAGSLAITRLAHGAKLRTYRVENTTTCEIAIAVTLSHRVDIDDDVPVTDAPLGTGCQRTRPYVYHLKATGIQEIVVTLSPRTHRILYIRPTWDAPGAQRISQRWVGAEGPFPPTGD